MLNASNFATDFFFLFHESECKVFHHDINSQLVLFSFFVYIVCFFFVYEPYRAYLCFTASVFLQF